MRILSKSLVVTVLCFFMSVNALAWQLTEQNVGTLSKAFYELMAHYPAVLENAVRYGNFSEVQSVVELNSPWYQDLELSKEQGDLILPRKIKTPMGEIMHYPHPFLSFYMLQEQFKLQKRFMKIEQIIMFPEYYIFKVDAWSVSVRFKDNVMKFFDRNP